MPLAAADRAQALHDAGPPDFVIPGRGRVVVPRLEMRDGGVLWVAPPDVPGMRVDPGGYAFVNPPTQITKTIKPNPLEGEDWRILEVNEPAALAQILRDAMLWYDRTPRAWGHDTLTVYSDASDGDITSSDATYATAVAGSALSVSDTALTDGRGMGQRFTAGSYRIFQTFLSFNTSSLTSRAVISAAVLSIFGFGSVVTETQFDAEARLFDFGTAIDTGDWRTDAQLTSATLLATFTCTTAPSWSTSAYNDFSDVAMPANVNKVGSTRMVLASSRNRTASAPSTTNPGDDETAGLHFSEETGTTNDPKLFVTFTVPNSLVLAGRLTRHPLARR